MKAISSLLFFLIHLPQIDSFYDSTKRVTLFNGEINVEVPSNWVQKDNYLKYTDYENAYNVRISTSDSSSLVTVNVHKKKYSEDMFITPNLIAVERQSDSLKWKKVKFIESGIRSINNIKKMGFIKYKFELKGTYHYMCRCFFKDPDGYYFLIEIYSDSRPISEFMKVGEMIFNSISLNLN